MTGFAADILIAVLYTLIVCVVVRALLTWFPQSTQPGGLVRLLHRVTDPLLVPVRRVVPTLGMIDISSILVIVLLSVMVTVVQEIASR